MSPLEFLFALLGYWLSLFGIFTFLLGSAAYVFLLLTPLSGYGKWISGYCFWVVTFTASRLAVVVSEHGDLYLKTMRFQGIGTERINFGGTSKDFSVLFNGLQNWRGSAFGLAWERDGVIFNPVHAAIAKREKGYREEDIDSIVSDDDDWHRFGIDVWTPGVYDLEKAYELVDLENIKWLVDGGERAEHPERVETLYEYSRRVLEDAKFANLKPLIPVGVFIGVLIAMWQLKVHAGQDASSGPTSDIQFGSMMAQTLIAAGIVPSIDEIDGGKVVGVLVGIVLLIFAALLFLFLGPVLFFAVLITFGMGFAAPVCFTLFLSMLGRKSSKIENLVVDIYMFIGLLGYTRPVFVMDETGYHIVEYSNLGETADVNWYGLKGKQVGFTFDPDSVEDLTVDVDKLDSAKVDDDSNVIPSGWVKCPYIQRGEYGGIIPKRLKKSKIWVDASIVLGRVTNTATGEKSQRRLQEAKDIYGEGAAQGMGDKTIMYTTLGAMVFGGVLGYFIFF